MSILDRVTGNCWTHRVYFYSDTKYIRGPNAGIGQDVVTKLRAKIGEDEDILKVYAFQSPLHSAQVSKLILFHMFLVFKTNKWWYSIEKCDEGIIIQRSKYLSAVKDEFVHKNEIRNRVSEMRMDKGHGSVHGLIKWLDDRSAQYSRYHIVFDNCQRFANSVYYAITEGFPGVTVVDVVAGTTRGILENLSKLFK